MTNKEFAFALKTLRLSFNLSQKKVAKIAGIIQSDYSAFERQKRELTLNNADLLSSKIWGVPYTKLVAFQKKKVIIKHLPKETQKAIMEAKNKILKDGSNFLAKELDRIIAQGFLNRPTTSKQILKMMDSSLWDRKPIEITNLFNKAPRKNYIFKLESKLERQIIYVHKDYKHHFTKLDTNNLREIIYQNNNVSSFKK